MLPRGLSRRESLLLAASGVASHSLSGWMRPLAARAAEQTAQGRKHKSCILLWMDGGPSQTDTFDPKPEAASAIHGDVAAIETSAPGIQVSEHFPQLARWMHRAALLRGMSTAEADHGRARIYMHTGYKPGFGGVAYPGLGSTVSAEIGDSDSPLPNFVVTGKPLNKYDVLRDAGYRGPRHQPLVLSDLSHGLENAAPSVATGEFNRRVGLLEELEQEFVRSSKSVHARGHEAGITAALRLMRSDLRQAFDLSLEKSASREAYGESDFGRGCLLARRLIEAGVAFVEVYLSNWDSHMRDVADQTRTLVRQVDQGTSALIGDLHDRGLLDDTLIVWMGEFGRTPRINTYGGRDHYAKAWTTALFGGGIRGGQAIGSTDGQGMEVRDRPISAADFFATICRLLGIDYRKEVIANGRPIRIVDKDERLIEELLS
jgi:uncharacterized protein (DUF1501 family)